MSVFPNGARSRADASSLLACTADGIWLWPGIPLTEKFGRTIRPIDKSSVLAQAAKFFGHAAHYSNVYRAVELAAEALTRGDAADAANSLARARLPSVSPDGADLLRAVAVRLGIAEPQVPMASGPRLWTADNVRMFAASYDRFAKSADALEALFSRGVPSRNLSKYNHDHDPDNGQFTSGDYPGDGNSGSRKYAPGYGVSNDGPDDAGKYDLKDADGNSLEGSQVFRNAKGKSECVTLVQGVLGAPAASAWTEGMKVDLKTIDRIPIGTPLATFVDGSYPMSGRNMHTGLYAGHDDTGIFLLDQYDGLKHVIVTHYAWTSTRANDPTPRIRSATNYSVIKWAANTPPRKTWR